MLFKKILFFSLFLFTSFYLSAQYVNLPENKADILPKTDYVIYMPWGTLPSLSVGLHMQLHKKPSFLWFYRDGTFNTDKLPAHVRMIGQPGRNHLKDIDLIAQEVSAIIASDPEASFTLYTDDMQSGRLTLTLLVANGVKEGHLFVRILSDGSGTYNFYKNLFNTRGVGLEVYNKSTAYFYSLYLRTNKNRNTLAIPSVNIMWADLANQMFALASFPFAELWLTYPDLLTSNDERMGFARMQINTRAVSPQFLFDNLPKAAVSNFMALVNFNQSYFDNLLKPESKSSLELTEAKPKLIVTTPDPIPDGLPATLRRIVRDYGETYDILIKPHPSAKPTHGQENSYKKLGVLEILPARMPMEVLLWAYPELKIGGFQSSLYMSAREDQVLFFIADGPSSLPEPLLSIYRLGVFNNAVFYPIPQ